MFPNPQDALPLPPRPRLEHYKKRAKDLVKACKSGDPQAIRLWAADWLESLASLQDAPQLRAWIRRRLNDVEQFARNQLSSGKKKCALAEAQFVIARSHGFESWPKFTQHLEKLGQKSSSVYKFELAADAIVRGDFATLQRLLQADVELVRARSTREHQATLLHYVSANGVEGFRQQTPKNAVRIARLLLQAGAEVDATAYAYGGKDTTLDLVATSIHPERAGVQVALMELLLEHGAAVDHPGAGGIVSSCLANGRGSAAEFLARRGAPLTLEGAAGVGMLDVVTGFFNEDGTLKQGTTKRQMERGFCWACEYGRNSVVEFLLEKDESLLTAVSTRETGLHWAVIGGQLDTVKLLLQRGASLEFRNGYGGTALGQALWSAVNGDSRIDHIRTIETLIAAGARIEDGSLTWLAEEESGSSSIKRRIAEVLRRQGAKS